MADEAYRGKLNATVNLGGTITSKISLAGMIMMPTGETHEIYTGEYKITPKIDQQTINTRDKALKTDVVVEPIPYYSVSNEQNGETIIIGGI